MAKKNNKGTAKLKKIVAVARKEYNKKGNNKKWVTCVKEAAKKMR